MLGNKQVMAKNISRLMKENNIGRKKLSDDLKVKYTTLSDWINAKTYPRIDKIELLADYFGVMPSDITEDKSTWEGICILSDIIENRITKGF